MIIDFSQRISERSEGFVGREWLFKMLSDWVASSTNRFLILQAEAGSGKSAIAAQLAQFSLGNVAAPDRCNALAPDYLAAHHFCARNSISWIEPLAFVQSLSEQLMRRSEAFRDAVVASAGSRVLVKQDVGTVAAGGQVIGAVLDLSGLSAEKALTQTILNPLSKLWQNGDQTPIIILIDSLDEAFSYQGDTSIVRLLQQLQGAPANLRFICTTRPQERITDPLKRAGATVIQLEDPAFHQHIKTDIVGYVRTKLDSYTQLVANVSAETIIAKISALADGNFLYLHYLLPLLAKRQISTLAELDSLRPGLDALYTEFLEAFQSKPEWKDYRTVLGVLAVAQIPLASKQIESLTAVEEVPSLLSDLRSLLDVNDSLPRSKRRYALYHRSFADFLLNEDAPDWLYRDPVKQHSKIAAYYINNFGTRWHKADDYGLRFVATHAASAILADENIAKDVAILIDLVHDAPFQAAHQQRFDNFVWLQRDMQLALSCAIANDDVENLATVLRASWLLMRFRQRALDPMQIFELARAGDLEAAWRRLGLFSADSQWLVFARLLTIWLAQRHNPAAAQEHLQALPNNTYIWPLQLMWDVVQNVLDGNTLQRPSLPVAPPEEIVRAMFDRFLNSEKNSEHIGLDDILRSMKEPDDASSAMLNEGISMINRQRLASEAGGMEGFQDDEPVYLAERDGRLLVAFAAEHGDEGSELFDNYVSLHAGNHYAFYRNRSLWILLEAILRHHNLAWVQRRLVDATNYALNGTALEFAGARSIAAWVASVADGADSAECYTHIEEVLNRSRDRDMWGLYKRELAAYAEAAYQLPATGGLAPQLLSAAASTEGYAGFHAAAWLALVESIYVTGGSKSGITDILYAAKAAANNIQDPSFCALSTARFTALSERWWMLDQPLDVETLIPLLVESPTDVQFAALHRIGEQFDERQWGSDKIEIPPHVVNAQSAEELALVYETSGSAIAELNQIVSYAVRPVGSLVAIPDHAMRYWVARRLSAELLVNPSNLPLDERIALMRQLMPLVADSISALDTLSARLILLTAQTALSTAVISEILLWTNS